MRSLNELTEEVRRDPAFSGVGMILTHHGVVRETTREGQRVSGLRVSVDREKLASVIAEQQKRPGIHRILVEINADKELSVGDDVMFLMVAGDIRDHVIPVLSDTLDAIKTSVTQKTQFFI